MDRLGRVVCFVVLAAAAGCRADIPSVLSSPEVDAAMAAWDASMAQAERAPEPPRLPDPQPTELPELFADSSRHTLQLRGARLDEALMLIAELGGLNLVLQGDFSQRVNLNLPSVDLQTALTTLVEIHGCGVQVDGDVVRLTRDSPASMRSRVFDLRAVRAEDVQFELARLVGDENLLVNPSRNVVMVNGSPETLGLAEAFLTAVDRPEPQVLIETRILEVSRSDLLELGARIAENSINVNQWTAGFVSDLLSPTPKVLATAATDTNSVDLTLDALQTLIDLQILQRPRLLALHGKEAKLEILQELPYVETTTTTESSTSAVGAQTLQEVEFKNIGLELTITPTIQADGLIGLSLTQRVSVQTGVFNDIPVVDSRNIETSFLVQNGETIVMGGLMQNSQRTRREAVPLLGDIPGLGQLFRNDQDQRGAMELVLLMTPRLVDPSPRRGASAP